MGLFKKLVFTAATAAAVTAGVYIYQNRNKIKANLKAKKQTIQLDLDVLLEAHDAYEEALEKQDMLEEEIGYLKEFSEYYNTLKENYKRVQHDLLHARSSENEEAIFELEQLKTSIQNELNEGINEFVVVEKELLDRKDEIQAVEEEVEKTQKAYELAKASVKEHGKKYLKNVVDPVKKAISGENEEDEDQVFKSTKITATSDENFSVPVIQETEEKSLIESLFIKKEDLEDKANDKMEEASKKVAEATENVKENIENTVDNAKKAEKSFLSGLFQKKNEIKDQVTEASSKVEETAEKMADTAGKNLEQKKVELKNLSENVKENMEQQLANVGSVFDETLDKGIAKSEDVKNSLKDSVDSFSDKMDNSVEKAQSSISRLLETLKTDK